MTISKGEDWGTEIDLPDGIVLAADDAEVARLLSESESSEIALVAGDLFTTIGARPLGDRRRVLRLPIDLVAVRLDEGDALVAAAHVIARSPWSRGGWWSGPVLAVMNAEFVGPYDVAPRGHPNDGRVESFELSESVSARQRLAIRRRMRTGTHLPHPGISHRPVRRGSWSFSSPLDVFVDGVSVGRSTTIDIEVRADAGCIHA